MQSKPVAPIPQAVPPAFSKEQLAKMSPIDRELAETLMQEHPTLTAERILAAINTV